MSKEELEQLDDRGMAAWDTHDADAWVGMFADGFEYHDWTLPEPIRDKAALRQTFEAWMTAFPDMKTTTVSRVIGEDSVAAEITFMGTNSGPMAMWGGRDPRDGQDGHRTGQLHREGQGRQGRGVPRTPGRGRHHDAARSDAPARLKLASAALIRLSSGRPYG